MYLNGKTGGKHKRVWKSALVYRLAIDRHGVGLGGCPHAALMRLRRQPKRDKWDRKCAGSCGLRWHQPLGRV